MSELRDYQREAVDSVWRYLAGGNRGSSLVVLPTGSGKSHVIAQLAVEVCGRFPDAHVLVVSHRARIVSQNARKLQAITNMAIGIYSAGLRQKRVARITVANIQSVCNKAFSLPLINMLIIDECHLVPDEGAGQYRRFINELRSRNEHLVVVGFTATAYRMKQGLLTEGEGRIFTDIVADVSVAKLIQAGHLSPLVGKGARAQADLAQVKVSNGEYVMTSAEQVLDRLTDQATDEIIRLGKDRNNWLIYCTGVDHAHHVVAALKAKGIVAEAILGDMDEQLRDRTVLRFEKGEIKALVSCDVLTTGFDSPQVDLIALLRPTRSTSLYVQILGRGMRTFPGKLNCLVLDFAGNLERHGPIDKITIGPRNREGRSELTHAPVKFCPSCQAMIPIQARECSECGAELVEETPSHEASATDGHFLSEYESLVPAKRPVQGAKYCRHQKKGKTPSMRVDYQTGAFEWISEWVCFEHEGIARRRAEGWWKEHGGFSPVPLTVDDALERVDELREVFGVYATKDGEYDRVIGVLFEPVETLFQ